MGKQFLNPILMSINRTAGFDIEMEFSPSSRLSFSLFPSLLYISSSVLLPTRPELINFRRCPTHPKKSPRAILISNYKWGVSCLSQVKETQVVHPWQGRGEAFQAIQARRHSINLFPLYIIFMCRYLIYIYIYCHKMFQNRTSEFRNLRTSPISSCIENYIWYCTVSTHLLL